MQLDPRDPLLTVKVRALRPLLRKSTIPWQDLTAAEALQAARALSLREVSASPAPKQALRMAVQHDTYNCGMFWYCFHQQQKQTHRCVLFTSGGGWQQLQ
jgi:acetyl esterase/lipase